MRGHVYAVCLCKRDPRSGYPVLKVTHTLLCNAPLGIAKIARVWTFGSAYIVNQDEFAMGLHGTYVPDPECPKPGDDVTGYTV